MTHIFDIKAREKIKFYKDVENGNNKIDKGLWKI